MKTYEFIGKSVYLKKEKILVIADLHLGYEESLIARGVFIPRRQYKETIENLEKIFKEIDRLENKEKLVKEKTIDNNEGGLINRGGAINKKEKIKEIIILGDLKHEFSGVLKQEWKETLDLLDYLKSKIEKNGKITLVRGNHDNYLINIAKKQGVEVRDFYVKTIGKEKICFMHGHKLFPNCVDKNIRTIIIGHMHPAISIRKNVKEEKYKCFLVGKYKGKKIIILPSFFPLVEGQDVNSEELGEGNLAFKPNFPDFGVYVPAENEVFDFGKLRDVGRLV